MTKFKVFTVIIGASIALQAHADFKTTIESKLGDICIDIYANSTATGYGVTDYTCTSGTASQNFTFTAYGGHWEILTDSGLCLDANNGSNKQLVQNKCSGSLYQAFDLFKQTDGSFAIVNFQNRECLSVLNSSKADRTAIYTEPCSTVPTNERFTLTGNPVFYGGSRGVNLSGAETNGTKVGAKLNTDYVYPTQAELNYYASKGFTTIRVPFSISRMQPKLSEALDATQLSYMDAVVSYAKTKGLTVILDPHNYGSMVNSAGVNTLIGSNSTVTTADFAKFWSLMATHYLKTSNVIFGLMNEPGQSPTVLRPILQAAVTAIRSTGAKQLILVPGPNSESAAHWIKYGAAAAFLGFTDQNFAFEVHQYMDNGASGSSPTCQVGAGGTLAPFTDWARQNHYHGFVGEVGWSSSSTCTPEATTMVRDIDAAKDVYFGFTYWAGGPWMGNYMYNLDPTGIGTSAQKDQPQMAIILAN